MVWPSSQSWNQLAEMGLGNKTVATCIVFVPCAARPGAGNG